VEKKEKKLFSIDLIVFLKYNVVNFDITCVWELMYKKYSPETRRPKYRVKGFFKRLNIQTQSIENLKLNS